MQLLHGGILSRIFTFQQVFFAQLLDKVHLLPCEPLVVLVFITVIHEIVSTGRVSVVRHFVFEVNQVLLRFDVGNVLFFLDDVFQNHFAVFRNLVSVFDVLGV